MPHPPIGASPHGYVYMKRIKDLQEAIGRYVTHIEQMRDIEDPSECYALISRWAKEIEDLSLLQIKLVEAEKRGKKYD